MILDKMWDFSLEITDKNILTYSFLKMCLYTYKIM